MKFRVHFPAVTTVIVFQTINNQNVLQLYSRAKINQKTVLAFITSVQPGGLVFSSIRPIQLSPIDYSFRMPAVLFLFGHGSHRL